MLTELRVANFAIIDQVSIVFRSGFNVLSGETGSGKSVLLKSLALLMGEKSVNDAIKTGASSATVEGLFDITKRPDIKSRLITAGISDAVQESEVDDLLVVKRIISTDGKNRVYINGCLSTLQQLREIVAPLIELTGRPTPLIEMTGQHENRHLQSKSFHLENLDEAIGTQPLRQVFNKLYQEHAKTADELANLKNLADAREQLDLISDAVNELPPRCYEAFVLRVIQSLPFDDVGRQMRISSRMAKIYVARTLETLKNRLDGPDRESLSNDREIAPTSSPLRISSPSSRQLRSPVARFCAARKVVNGSDRNSTMDHIPHGIAAVASRVNTSSAYTATPPSGEWP